MNSDFYMQIPNSFWNIYKELTKQDVFSELLFLYSYILTEKSYSRSNKEISFTSISVNAINVRLKLLNNDKHPEQNKKKIKKLLLRLKQLGLIFLQDEDFGYGDTIDITIKNIQESDSQGYQKIYAHIFECCAPTRENDFTGSHDYFAILCYIKKCEGYKDTISYYELANAIGRSYPFTVRMVSNLETSGLISVIHGKYYVNEGGKYRQEKNRYKHVSNERQRQMDEWSNAETKLQLSNFIYAIRYKNEDQKLAAIVDRRIEKISSSPAGEKYINDMMDKARNAIEMETA